MYNDHYALAFNPFDKQQLPEKDCFRFRGFKNSCLEKSREVKGFFRHQITLILT